MKPDEHGLLPLIVATRNSGKAREFSLLLAGLPLRLETLEAHPEAPQVDEDGQTYLANAEAKAVAVARACGVPALADDSGLEVDALGGQPGVRSARFSTMGERGNVERVLAELRSVPETKRTARFRCVLIVARPDGCTISAEGTCEGTIAFAPAGTDGFGYDPVFVDPESGRTFAELPADRKNQISHRARACAALRGKLMEFLAG